MNKCWKHISETLLRYYLKAFWSWEGNCPRPPDTSRENSPLWGRLEIATFVSFMVERVDCFFHSLLRPVGFSSLEQRSCCIRWKLLLSVPLYSIFLSSRFLGLLYCSLLFSSPYRFPTVFQSSDWDACKRNSFCIWWTIHVVIRIYVLDYTVGGKNLIMTSFQFQQTASWRMERI